MQVVAIATPGSRDWRWRIVDYSGGTMEESRETFASIATALASGAKSYPKERIECFWDGKTVAIDNWRRLRRFGVPGAWLERGGRMDKGHAAEIAAWHAAVRSGGPSPIPLDEIVEVSRWAIRAAEQAR